MIILHSSPELTSALARYHQRPRRMGPHLEDALIRYAKDLTADDAELLLNSIDRVAPWDYPMVSRIIGDALSAPR